MSMELDRRGGGRVRVQSAAELVWRDDAGRQQWEHGQVVNVSATGMAIDCPEPVTPSSCVIVVAAEAGIASLTQVRHCAWLRSQYRFGVQIPTRPSADSSGAIPSHEDLLRTGLGGDTGAFEQLYRPLAFRYHPDNQETGDSEVFLQIREIHRIFSGAKNGSGGQKRYPLRSDLSLGGEDGSPAALPGKVRRIDVLRLLYERKVADCYSSGVAQQDLQAETGLAGNQLQFILWYLREKGAITVGDSQVYSISAAGVDLYDEAYV
jgi:hypothetical protein